jgi:3-oxoadipate enol-lactonase
MPTATVNGNEYYYEEKGSGFPIVFGNSLLFDHRMWDQQVETLSSRYRCITYDFLGHGGSSVGAEGYSLEDEAANLHALMEQWGASPAHMVGLSMGGMVDMRLALAHPEDVRSLALLDTSAEEEVAERQPQYEAMAAAARARGPESVVDAVVPFFFSQGFQQSHPEPVAAFRQQFIASNFDGIELATQAVTRRTSVLDKISQIKLPTLVIVGSDDISTTPDRAQHIAEGIAGARLETIAGSGHMTAIEQPERISQLLSEFLAQVDSASPK